MFLICLCHFLAWNVMTVGSINYIWRCSERTITKKIQVDYLQLELKKIQLITSPRNAQHLANRNKNLLIRFFKIKSKSVCHFSLPIKEMDQLQHEHLTRTCLYLTICSSNKNIKKVWWVVQWEWNQQWIWNMDILETWRKNILLFHKY